MWRASTENCGMTLPPKTSPIPVAQGVRRASTESGQAVEGVGEGECPVEEASGRSVFGQADPKGSFLGKLLGPAKRKRAVVWVRERLGAERVSERRACQVLGQARSTQRRERHIPDDEARLVAEMVELATHYGRYGYRRITAMLRWEGWKVNHKRVFPAEASLSWRKTRRPRPRCPRLSEDGPSA